MKSLTRNSNLPILGILGLLFLVIAAWVWLGLAAGLGATGVALLYLDYTLGGES